MYFPSFWMRTGRGAGSVWIETWGWGESPDAAQALAHQRAGEAQARMASGWVPDRNDWYYSRIPLRESVVDVIEGSGTPSAVITRNRMGALVLNSTTLFIADIDVPGWEDLDKPHRRGFFRRRRPIHDIETPVPESVFAPVGRVLAANLGVGMRLYRTRAGLRLILTGVRDAGGAPLVAGTPESQALLRSLGSDPLYVDLSATYGSYRARLTPKPWRCGVRGAHPKPVRIDEVVSNAAFAADPAWVSAYDKACEGFATCRLLSVEGSPPSAVEAAVLAVHDRLTRVGVSLPLA